MNDSGTTFLQNSLHNCSNCISFHHPKKRPHGIEGQGVCYYKGKKKNYPRDIDHGVMKLFSEKKQIWQDEAKFNWPEIKKAWDEAWRKNPKWHKTKKKVLLEKTPSSLFSLLQYVKQFPNALFIILIRDPYAVCEGIKRTTDKKKKGYSIERCAKHWVKCSKQQKENIAILDDKCILIKYEDLVTNTNEVQQRIRQFIPLLEDIDFFKKARAHCIDGSRKQPVKDFNKKQLQNLNKKQFYAISDVLLENMDIMSYFGYKIRTGN